MNIRKYLALGTALTLSLSLLAGCGSGSGSGDDQIVIYSNADEEAITAMDWLAMLLICFVLPGILCWAFGLILRRIGWIKPGDLTLG